MSYSYYFELQTIRQLYSHTYGLISRTQVEKGGFLPAATPAEAPSPGGSEGRRGGERRESVREPKVVWRPAHPTPVATQNCLC